MADETDNAEALEAAGQDADSMGTDAPDGVMKCRQLDTEHELEEPTLLEIEAQIEPPEGSAGLDPEGAQGQSEADPDSTPEAGAGGNSETGAGDTPEAGATDGTEA